MGDIDFMLAADGWAERSALMRECGNALLR